MTPAGLTDEQWGRIIVTASRKLTEVWERLSGVEVTPLKATPDDPRPGSVYHRVLDDKHEITVYPMMFGEFRVCIGERGLGGGIYDSYHYNAMAMALRAAVEWDGKAPIMDGWHYSTRWSGPHARVYRKNADPAQESYE